LYSLIASFDATRLGDLLLADEFSGNRRSRRSLLPDALLVVAREVAGELAGLRARGRRQECFGVGPAGDAAGCCASAPAAMPASARPATILLIRRDI
jgi:hypothetical protein